MVRSVERFDGLATVGAAAFGGLRTATPGILWAGEGDVVPEGGATDDRILLSAGTPAAPGHRTLALSAGTTSLRIDFPIPAPEISGAPIPPHEAAPGVWVVHWPPPTDGWDVSRARRSDLVVLSNARTLLLDGEPFLEAIHGIRTRLGYGPALWAPRVALPHRLAWLAYVGVDLVDSTEAAWRAASGEFLLPELGAMDARIAQRERMCSCPGCQRDGPVDLALHAAFAMDRELRIVRGAARQGRLRELVEARLAGEPILAELLRHTDRLLAPLLEERTPVVDSTSRSYVYRESQRRPEVRRFRERVLQRYRPPPSKDILLLVPCSRKKPYRLSRSHRRFALALDGLRQPARVHKVSVSSPLGAVPRELEDIFPARHYDIPVTGDWESDEREMVHRSLDHLLRTGSYGAVVVHLDPAEYGFLRGGALAADTVRWTLSDDHTTSPAAVDSLRHALLDAEQGLAARPAGPMSTVREELEALASVQLGPEAARLLFANPIRLAGRPWFQRLTDGHGTDLATWREERGLFHLTVAGGQRIHPARALWVEVTDEVPLTGDLFTPGVAKADASIRVGDAVVLTRHNEVVAVGEAELPGPAMTDLARGLAVSVRHRARPLCPAAQPTAT